MYRALGEETKEHMERHNNMLLEVYYGNPSPDQEPMGHAPSAETTELTSADLHIIRIWVEHLLKFLKIWKRVTDHKDDEKELKRVYT